MQVIITGGTGFIGSLLSDVLIKAGHEVIVLTRNAARRPSSLAAAARLVEWDALTGKGWSQLIHADTVIVNLAGEPIEGGGFIPKRWTDERRKRILESRLNAGKAVVDAVENAAVKPQAVIQSSAVGYYGYSDDRILTEEASAGSDFLAEVCVQWEASTTAVESMGIRRPIIRTGLPLHKDEGVLPRLVLPFKLFGGGPMGNGKQYYPWIHIDDEIGAIHFLIDSKDATGPYNLTAPNPVTNKEFAKILGKVMKRPSWMPVPGPALRLMLGEVANLALKGQRVVPARLEQSGYNFKFPHLEGALVDLLRGN